MNENLYPKLCFDCDDTLYDLAWPFYQAMKDFLPEVFEGGYDLEKMYQEYRGYGDDLFDLLQEGTITPDDSGILRIVKICRQYGLHLEVLDAWHFQDAYRNYQYQVQMNTRFSDWLKTYPGELAILTNGQTEHQHRKIHSLQTDRLMPADHICASQELGYRKPDPRAFQEMFSRLNQDCRDWYYIGDSYVNDMEGAKLAGMKTIHFNRHHTREGSASDYVVYTEDELLDLLERLKESEIHGEERSV